MKIKKLFSMILSAILLFQAFSFNAFAVTENTNAEVLPTTWAAVDGLNRTLSLNNSVGDKRDDRFVGMFYWIWHYTWADTHEPITTGSILNKYPEALNDWDHPAWNVQNQYDGRPYFWDEPLYGFYSTLDEYVLRNHAELLADADIDVVFFDTTNSDILFEDGLEKLLKVWSEAIADGVNAPKISFVLNFGNTNDICSQLERLYDNIYSKGRYSELYFYWDGKPMLMGDASVLDMSNEKHKEISEFFTFRRNESTYFNKDTSVKDNTWGWCSDYPQAKFGKDLRGNVEQMCVSVAQNANEYGLAAMNSQKGTIQGRSFTDGKFSYSYTYKTKEQVVDKNTENAMLYGLNFQQQWDYAIEQDPEFIFVTGFNEWVAGRWQEWQGTENAFPDQFSPEYSRDIEPSKGVLKDHYYYQLVENVRRFKGADASLKTDAKKSIDITNGASQWDDVLPEYNHYTGNINRDSNGWLGTHYVNATFRNDIVKAKVAYDDENVYFYVKTADTLTAESEPDWMCLLIDTDTTGALPNFEGFEYVVNRVSPENGKATLEKANINSSFSFVDEVNYTVNNNVLQLEIPRTSLGITGENVKLNFKWTDNCNIEDIMSVYTDGDSAPGGRFTFVFDSTNTVDASDDATTDDNDTSFSFAKLIKNLESLLKFIPQIIRALFGN